MAVIKFQKKEEPEILFGIKLPEIVKNLYYEIKNRDRFLAVLKETFNINEDRYLKIVNARDLKGNDTLIAIENIIGSAFSDTFKGNNVVSNTFNGGMNLTTQVENVSDENDTVDYSSLTGLTDKIIVDLSNTTTANVAQAPPTAAHSRSCSEFP